MTTNSWANCRRVRICNPRIGKIALNCWDNHFHCFEITTKLKKLLSEESIKSKCIRKIQSDKVKGKMHVTYKTHESLLSKENWIIILLNTNRY